MTVPYIRKPYERTRVPVDLEGQQSKTDRSHGNDTDINNIVARFARTGELPPGNGEGDYADVTGLQNDLTEIIEKGRQAQNELHDLQIKQDAEQAAKIKENEKTAAANAARLAELEALHSQTDS